ncbi:hypothetical protein ACQBAR_00245 [Propionibacteriaceae bacterium Y1685]
MGERRPGLLTRLVVSWIRWSLAMLALFLIFCGGMLIFMADWRHHMLGGTDEQTVTITHIGQRTEKCGSKVVSGRRAQVTWTDREGPHQAWWVACPKDRAEAGTQRQLWVSSDKQGYDYAPWEIWTMLPKSALLGGALLSVITLWRPGAKKAGQRNRPAGG